MEDDDSHDRQQAEQENVNLLNNEENNISMNHAAKSSTDVSINLEELKPQVKPIEETKSFLDNLIPDWRDQDLENPKKYLLIQKLGDLSDKDDILSLDQFTKLFKVFNDESQMELYYFCLKAIYFYFDEFECKVICNEKMQPLIESVLSIKNEFYRTQILRILIVYLNERAGAYESIKSQILSTVDHNFDHTSCCMNSYESMEKHCDNLYFQLAFLLKANRVMAFEVEYKKYVEKNKEYFGEYFATATRTHSHLFYFIAERQGLISTKEFLAISTQDPHLKCSIKNFFIKLDEFHVVFDKTMEKNDQKLLIDLDEIIKNNNYILNEENIPKWFENKPKVRKFLFGRAEFGSDSLFEKILLSSQTEGNKPENLQNDHILNFIWNKFELWDKPEILTMRNHKQDKLFDLVLDSKYDPSIIMFLSSEKYKYSVVKRKPMLYMMLKNSLFYDYKSQQVQDNNGKLQKSVTDDHNCNGNELENTVPDGELQKSVTDDHNCNGNELENIVTNGELQNGVTDDQNGTRNETNFNNPNEEKRLNDPKCLIEYHFSLIDKNEKNDYNNIANLFYLFEELSQYSKERSKEKCFLKIFEKVILEKCEDLIKGVDPKLARKHFMLGIMMIYWNFYIEFSNNEEGEQVLIVLKKIQNPEKKLLQLISINIPFFKILSDIIRCTINQDFKAQFLNTYSDEILKMENSFELIYNIPSITDEISQQEGDFHFYEKYATNLSYVFLYGAIKTNQIDIVRKIFKFHNFLICSLLFPINMEVNEIHTETALLFLENRYELGRADLPEHWITHDLLEHFLDSRISQHNGFYKVDCRFMLPYYNYGTAPCKKSQLNDNYYMNEDYDTMEYILKDNNLKSLVTHPVIELFIRAKMQKYNQIAFANLFLFILTYILPTTFFVYDFHKKESNHEKYSYWSYSFILFRLASIVPRELFQFLMIYKGQPSKYFKKISNIVETILILLPPIFLIIVIAYNNYPESMYKTVVWFEVITIILMIIGTVILMPVLKFAMYMKCFIQVLVTYLNVFLIFLPLIFGSAGLAFIIFDKDFGGNIEDFQYYGTAVMKYIIMYSGEIGIEPREVTKFIQGVAITLIIIFIINKSNLILSMVINDTEEIMRRSKSFNLTLNARKYVEFAKYIREFYAIKIEGRDDISFTNRKMFKAIKFFLSKSLYVHQLQSIYIDQTTRSIYADTNKLPFEFNVNKSQCIRTTSNYYILQAIFDWGRNYSGGFIIDDEIMDEIQKVVRKKNSRDKKAEESDD